MKTALIYFYGQAQSNRGLKQLEQSLVYLRYSADIISEEEKKYPTSLMFLNISLFFRIFTYVRREQPSLIFCRESPAALPLLFVAKLTKTPIYLDIRELLPSNINSNKKFMPFLNYWFAALRWSYERLELFCMSRVTGVMFSTPQLKNYYERAGGKGNWCVIHNVPSIKWLPSESKIDYRSYQYDEKLLTHFVFAGYLVPSRKLDLLVHAVHKVSKRNLNGHTLQLSFVGDGAHKLQLMRLVKDLELQSVIDFHGTVQSDRLIDYLTKFDFGVLTNDVNELSQYTIPGKLFEYMCAGLPVIASLRESISNIIMENKIGWMTSELTVDALEESLLAAILSNNSQRRDMKKNAIKAIQNKYNLEHQICTLKAFLHV